MSGPGPRRDEGGTAGPRPEGPRPRPAASRHATARGGASKRRGRGRAVAVALLVAWAAAATAFGIWNRFTVGRLVEEQADLRQSYDDKVRALTRRLVGVASHQMLEQDGLSDQMADIIARQAELERRQASLVLLAERLNGTGLPGVAPGPAPAPVRDDDRAGARGRSQAPATEPVPSLKLGPAAPADPAPNGGRPRAEGGPAVGPGGRAARAEAGSLREEFAVLQRSIGRVETGQIRLVGALASGIHHGIGTVRTALGGLGLAVPDAGAPDPAVRPGRGGPARATGSFEEKVAAIEGEFVVLQRWKAVVDATPLLRPVEGDNNLTSNFGSRKDPFTGEGRMHAGIDFRGPIGTPIRAAGAGRVITADGAGGYGNLVEIEHGNGLVTRYAHLSAIQVAVGTVVTPGTVIGLLGSTGRSTGPHLHYETRLNGGPLDPMRFILAGAQLFQQPLPIDLTPDPASDDPIFD